LEQGWYLAYFLFRQWKMEYPLIDLRLFRLPTFNTALITLLLGVFVAFGVFLFLSQYLQLVLGLSPFESGMWMLPWALAFVVGSILTPRIVRRVSPISLIATGLAVAAVGFGLLIQIDATTSFLVLTIGLVISSLGLAPVFTLTTDIVVGSAPPERAGAASGISETIAELGGALGIAVLGSLGVSIYRTELARALPQDIPVEAQEVALQSLGGALSLVGHLPSGLGSMLVDIALDSFIHGFQVTVIISAGITAVVATLVC
jgi:DHA2 family multidrug resistance protein-like MFS transporter